ncbi:hypothetical protein J3F83DRAFT_745615 [Trichoderma novae-zelandiae]
MPDPQMMAKRTMTSRPHSNTLLAAPFEVYPHSLLNNLDARALLIGTRQSWLVARGRGPTGWLAIGLDGTRELLQRSAFSHQSHQSSCCWRMEKRRRLLKLRSATPAGCSSCSSFPEQSHAELQPRPRAATRDHGCDVTGGEASLCFVLRTRTSCQVPQASCQVILRAVVVAHACMVGQRCCGTWVCLILLLSTRSCPRSTGWSSGSRCCRRRSLC